MRRLTGLWLVVALVVTSSVPAFAQGEAKEVKLLRYSGNIVLVGKDESSFVIQSGNQKNKLFFDDKTVFTTLNKTGSSAQDLKEGRRVICMVDTSDKDRPVARRVDFRTER